MYKSAAKNCRVGRQMSFWISSPGESEDPDHLESPPTPNHTYKHLPKRWDYFAFNEIVTCGQCKREMSQALLPGHLRKTHGVQNPFELIP